MEVMSAMRPKVILDAGPAVHQAAGLGRYATELAAALWRGESNRTDLALFYNDHSGHRLPAALADVPSWRLPMGQYRWRLSALASQVVHRPNLQRHLPPGDVYHATEHLLPRMARRTVLTVHDLIFRHLPETHTLRNRAFLATAMPIFARRADAIIAVSEQTKRDVVTAYGVPEAKVEVIPEGIDQDLFQPACTGCDLSQALRQRHGDYLLMVGTLEPRKNHAAAARALAILNQRGRSLNLVVVGGSGWKFSPFHQLVEELNLVTRVHFAGRVPDAELPAYYTNARVLLQPSLYEGFGFPILEAMACAAPVVSSNRSSLPELAGDCALLVDPTEPDAIAHAVEQVLDQPRLRSEMIRGGRKRAATFTWAEAARRTADIYLSLL